MIDWKRVADTNGLSYKEFESELITAAFAMLSERLKTSRDAGDSVLIDKSGHRMIFTKIR